MMYCSMFEHCMTNNVHHIKLHEGKTIVAIVTKHEIIRQYTVFNSIFLSGSAIRYNVLGSLASSRQTRKLSILSISTFHVTFTTINSNKTITHPTIYSNKTITHPTIYSNKTLTNPTIYSNKTITMY